MAIAHDATTSSSSSSASGLTFSHTVSGSDRLLIVSVGWNSSGTLPVVSSVTYNGVSCSQVSGAESFAAHQFWSRTGVDLWSLVAPATGAHDVVVTMSASSNVGMAAGASSFTGVDQSTPLGTAASNTGTSAIAPSVTVSSATGEVVVGIAHTRASNAASFSSSDTELWEDFATGNGVIYGGAMMDGEASAVLNWTGQIDGWHAAAVPVKPAGTGGPTDFEGTGDLDAQSSSIAGAGVVGRAASGALSAQSSQISGTVTVNRAATGTLTAQSVTIDGEGDKSGSTDFQATGSLSAQAASIAGAGTVNRAASGVLTAVASTISADGSLSRAATGALTGQAATIDGTGSNSAEVYHWVIPTNAPDGQLVAIIVFDDDGVTKLEDGTATSASGQWEFEASTEGLSDGAKKLAGWHQWDLDADTQSIFGGFAIATAVLQ